MQTVDVTSDSQNTCLLPLAESLCTWQAEQYVVSQTRVTSETDNCPLSDPILIKKKY